MTIHLIYITAANKAEAVTIATTLVAEKLAACANILDGIHSIYWWNHEVEESQEAVIIAKTTEAHLTKLTERVKALHSYSCPCIVAMPITQGNSAFLEWVSETLK